MKKSVRILHNISRCIGLRVQLGHPPGPVQEQHQVHPRPARGPSYQRRQERHQAEPASAAEMNAVAEESSAAQVGDEATEEDQGTDSDIAEEVILDKTGENANFAVQANSCDFCEKTFSSVKGVKAHEGRVHKPSSSPIPQLDGVGDMSSESEMVYTFVSNYAEEDIKEAFKELYDDNLLPNLPTLISRERVNPRSADHHCKVKLKMLDNMINFIWPVLPDCPDFFKDVMRL